MSAIAGSMKKRGGAREILRNAGPLAIQKAQAGAPLHRATLTCFGEEPQRNGRVFLDACTVLIQYAKSGAPFEHVAITRPLEELRTARVIAQDVLAFEHPDREAITGHGASGLAIVLQPFGLRVLGMAPRKRETCHDEQYPADRATERVQVRIAR
jgi:hypothetical protein